MTTDALDADAPIPTAFETPRVFVPPHAKLVIDASAQPQMAFDTHFETMGTLNEPRRSSFDHTTPFVSVPTLAGSSRFGLHK